MLRQVSHSPLSTPRAAPPVGAVPLGTPAWDAPPSTSAAFGSTGPSMPEPNLPPPNLSDDARNQHAPAEVDRLTDPLGVDSATVDVGRRIFLNRCTQCHSIDGQGIGPVGGYLVPAPVALGSATVQRRSDGALFWSITQGEGKMPGFRNWTTVYQRWALVGFVRSLKNVPQTSVRKGPEYPLYGDPSFERRQGGPDDGQ